MARTKIAIGLLIFWFGFSHAQVNRYMVFFKDKIGSPYSINNPSEFLSDKSIQRRMNQNISVTESDIPVNETYVQSISGTGAKTLYRTRWMNGVLVSCDVTLIASISSLPEVESVVMVAPGPALNGGRIKSTKNRLSTHTEVTNGQLSLIGINTMHSDGFKGAGITIAVLDAGFPGVNTAIPFAHVFSSNRFNGAASFNFVQGTSQVFQNDDHGTKVLSVIGAYQENTFVGGAYEADFLLYITEDVNSEHHVEEYNWLFAAERADSTGVDIINTSLGYSTFDSPSISYTTSQMDGTTPVITRAAQFAADKGILVITSAGNEGNDPLWGIISAPADARDILAIGNVTSAGLRSITSSTGPTGDGRIKPDVMAMGTGVSVIGSNGNVTTASGTSLSAPLVTSLAAGLWQRYPDLTNKELMEVIRLSASQANSPDNFMGYGIPNYKAVKNYLEHPEQEELIAVFPNPITNNYLTVRPKNPGDNQSMGFSICNTQGQLINEGVVQFSWLYNQYTADVSLLASGVYILKIQIGSGVYSYRLVKL